MRRTNKRVINPGDPNFLNLRQPPAAQTYTTYSRVKTRKYLSSSRRLKKLSKKILSQSTRSNGVVQRRTGRRLRGWLSYLLITVIAVMVGLLSPDLVTGQWIAGITGLGMLLLKLDSHYSYFIALCLLILVPVFLVYDRNFLADNYAVYSYYFLIFGLVASIRELTIHKR